jgi:hypothetical protein
MLGNFRNTMPVGNFDIACAKFFGEIYAALTNDDPKSSLPALAGMSGRSQVIAARSGRFAAASGLLCSHAERNVSRVEH